MSAMQRPLTANEIDYLRQHPVLARSRAFPSSFRDLKLCVVIFAWLELLLGLPFGLLFFVTAYFSHSYSLVSSLRMGFLPGFIVPIGLIILLTIVPATMKGLDRLRGRRDHRETVLQELKAGIGAVTTFRPVAAHPVMDGDNTTPYMLLKLPDDRWICISDLDWRQHFEVFAPTDSVEICKLPRTNFPVSWRFSGRPVPVRDTVHTDNVWRNDDLPFDEPFTQNQMPAELADQLYR